MNKNTRFNNIKLKYPSNNYLSNNISSFLFYSESKKIGDQLEKDAIKEHNLKERERGKRILDAKIVFLTQFN